MHCVLETKPLIQYDFQDATALNRRSSGVRWSNGLSDIQIGGLAAAHAKALKERARSL